MMTDEEHNVDYDDIPYINGLNFRFGAGKLDCIKRCFVINFRFQNLACGHMKKEQGFYSQVELGG